MIGSRRSHKSHESHRACRAVGLAEADPIRGRPPVRATRYPLQQDAHATLIRRAALGVLGDTDLFPNRREQILDTLPVREIDYESW